MSPQPPQLEPDEEVPGAAELLAEVEDELEAEAEVEAEFEALPTDTPHVGIVMGHKTDLSVMDAACDELTARGILHEVRVMSPDDEPDLVAEYAQNAHMRGIRVIIAGAVVSAALPGMVATHTDLPVIGVPLTGDGPPQDGIDALLTMALTAEGVPVACVGPDQARNAAILAAQILSA